jgi:PAS domain S-box-containing protein
MKDLNNKSYQNTITSMMERSNLIPIVYENAPHWPVKFISKNTERILGYTQQEFLSGTILFDTIFHPEDVKIFLEELQELINSRDKNKISCTHKPFRIISKDGNVKWFYNTTNIIVNKKGTLTHFEGLLVEITIEKNRDLSGQILKEKERFKAIIENTGEWFWELDLNGNFNYTTKTVFKISGYTKKELEHKNITDFVENKYKNDLSKKFNQYILEKKGWKNILIKFKHKNGSLRYLESNATPFFNSKNELIGFRGINRDITNRIIGEKEIKKLLTVVKQSPNAIMITDVDNNIEYINPTFENYFGYSAKEVQGKNPRVLKSGHHSDEFYAQLQKTIHSGKIWKGELLNKTKNGNLVWVNTTISPLTNQQGKIVNYFSIQQNITQEKEKDKQLHETLQKLEENQAHLNDILQTANEGFWAINNNAQTIDVNPKMCEILEYSKAEIIKKSIYDFVNIKNSEIFKKQLEKRKLGLKSTYEIELQTKTGKKIVCLFKTSPMFDYQKNHIGSFAFVTNITTIKNTAIALKEKNKKLNQISFELSEKNRLLTETTQRYQNLFEENPIALWEEDFTDAVEMIKTIKDTDIEDYLTKNREFLLQCLTKIKVTNANQAAVKLFKAKSKSELLSNFGKDFTENTYPKFIKELVAIYQNQKVITHQTTIKIYDDSIIHVIIKIVQIAKYKTIVSLTDITEITKAKQKLQQQYKELLITKEKAEESNRLKTEFLNNMSHEIRTPMNGILGFSDLLNNDEITPEKRANFIKIIKNSGNQLLRVIDDILEISKLGTKQVTADKSEVCINNLMVELFSIFEIKSKETGVPIYLKKSLSDQDSTIITDANKLNKILSNLLENAYKFTNSGFIEFGYKLYNNWLQIYVKDTGVGVSPEKKEAIFERFSQEEKELSKKFGGLGLGLSIAKENARILGGNISLVSTKGVGSTFTVSIPYKPVNTAIKSNSTTNIKNSNKTKAMILITEDEQANFIFLETLILDVLNLNCTLHHAKNGKEAVTFCQNNLDIDLILMDLKMPIMNGFEATKIIKKSFPKIPIIAQTAYSTSDDKNKASDAGCDDFISKPISKDILKAVLNKYLKI